MKKFLFFIIVLFLCSCTTENKTTKFDIKDYELIIGESLYAFDINNYKLLVENADISFVGEVLDMKSPEYLSSSIPTSVGDSSPTPITPFKVKVIENIKGNQNIDSELEIYIHGGIAKNNPKILILTDTTFPIVNNKYIFTLYIQDDGKLLATGENSSIEYDKEIVDIMKGR